MVLKFTYDNTFWGFATSHLETEGPIVTGGFVGGDIGGNITIRFKANGGFTKHNIRGFAGGHNTPPYLSCEIGGEVEFYTVSKQSRSWLSLAIAIPGISLVGAVTYLQKKKKDIE